MGKNLCSKCSSPLRIKHGCCAACGEPVAQAPVSQYCSKCRSTDGLRRLGDGWLCQQHYLAHLEDHPEHQSDLDKIFFEYLAKQKALPARQREAAIDEAREKLRL